MKKNKKASVLIYVLTLLSFSMIIIYVIFWNIEKDYIMEKIWKISSIEKNIILENIKLNYIFSKNSKEESQKKFLWNILKQDKNRFFLFWTSKKSEDFLNKIEINKKEEIEEKEENKNEIIKSESENEVSEEKIKKEKKKKITEIEKANLIINFSEYLKWKILISYQNKENWQKNIFEKSFYWKNIEIENLSFKDNYYDFFLEPEKNLEKNISYKIFEESGSILNNINFSENWVEIFLKYIFYHSWQEIEKNEIFYFENK